MVWLPWSTRAGTVEANILYLGPGEQLPPLPVNGHFQFPATSQLRDVAGDVAQHGCQQCTVEALAIFARPLPYLNNVTNDVPAAATSDTDSDLTDVIVTDADPGVPDDPAPAAAAHPDVEATSSDVIIPALTHVQQQRLDTRVQSLMIHLTDRFAENEADDPFQSAWQALTDSVAAVDRTALNLLRAPRDLSQTLDNDDTTWE